MKTAAKWKEQDANEFICTMAVTWDIRFEKRHYRTATNKETFIYGKVDIFLKKHFSGAHRYACSKFASSRCKNVDSFHISTKTLQIIQTKNACPY